jgi:arylsulfatase A-like enzyme
MILFDSLNRQMLQPYGASWVHTPNFERLARHAVTFDQSYVCSMPCMPARRDLHTGRPNFLHRSWGPIEPFDDSMPEMLDRAGVHTHLCTDHQHYWEDGGSTYHPRYTTFDIIRGQEGDPWIGQVGKPAPPDREIPRNEKLVLQDAVNRTVTSRHEAYPLNVTFRKGLEFIQRNHQADQWMLQIEAFDPHEPFYTHAAHRKPYAGHFDAYPGKPVEWPPYRDVRESQRVVEHARHEYAALVSACDAKLGEVLDSFDNLDLWDDTMLIVWTDHGFLLGEHDCWAKCWMPFYDEVAHTPFFLWDPRHPKARGMRRQALVQPSIDLAPTLLRFFGLEPTETMLGADLSEAIANDQSVRDSAIFGIFGGHVNITDGHHVYMRGPVSGENQPLANYTLMPTHMRSRFTPEEISTASLAPPFSFTKACPLLRMPASYGLPGGEQTNVHLDTMLFDLKTDPQQNQCLTDAETEAKCTGLLCEHLRRNDAPAEQWERLGLP